MSSNPFIKATPESAPPAVELEPDAWALMADEPCDEPPTRPVLDGVVDDADPLSQIKTAWHAGRVRR